MFQLTFVRLEELFVYKTFIKQIHDYGGGEEMIHTPSIFVGVLSHLKFASGSRHTLPLFHSHIGNPSLFLTLTRYHLHNYLNG